jgi:hypothetical protein
MEGECAVAVRRAFRKGKQANSQLASGKGEKLCNAISQEERGGWQTARQLTVLACYDCRVAVTARVAVEEKKRCGWRCGGVAVGVGVRVVVRRRKVGACFF